MVTLETCDGRHSVVRALRRYMRSRNNGVVNEGAIDVDFV